MRSPFRTPLEVQGFVPSHGWFKRGAPGVDSEADAR